MLGCRPALLAASLALGACAGELGELGVTATPPVAAFVSAPATNGAGPAVSTSPRRARGERARKSRGPIDGVFIFSHFSAGVFSTILIQPATYFVAAKVGETGHGLGPAIGALLLGAFVPPILSYTVQWAMGRVNAPRRDRFWPGFLVRQVAHLGIFAAAVVGGADFRNPRHAIPIMLGEAVIGSGLSTMTAELTRRPTAVTAGATTEIFVPVVKVRF